MKKDIDNKNRIFTLAWEFPPITSGESVVCLRTLKYSRHYYDVCCGRVTNLGQVMVSLPKNIKNYPLPGKYLLWPLYAILLFKKLDKINNYQVMMSRVMPPNGHMAGLLIKLLKPKIKWAVYFSDPIWNSPFIKMPSLFLKNEDQRPNYLVMKLFGIPSKIAIHFGDILIFNNQRLARYVLGKKYEEIKDRVVIAPYGHEGIFDCNQPIRKQDEVVFTHVGQIYGNRSLKVLIEALEILQKQYSHLYKRLKFKQVGFICKKELERIEHSHVAECFEIIGQVEYDVSIQYMKSADYLLVLDPFFEQKEQNVYVPAKIFDYMSTSKPIVAIADADSATADIMIKIESLFAPHNAKAVYEMFRKILHIGIRKPNLSTYSRFELKYGSNKLDDAFQRCLNTSNEGKK